LIESDTVFRNSHDARGAFLRALQAAELQFRGRTSTKVRNCGACGVLHSFVAAKTSRPGAKLVPCFPPEERVTCGAGSATSRAKVHQAKVMIGSFVVALAALVAVAQSAFVVPPSSTKATNYQKWAHYHWVWLKNDLGNQANETALVQGYKDANIPVGALNIDSTWATQYNNFVVNTDKFPDFKGLIDDLHKQGIKVTMWYVALS
jgi:hypothetical protein